MDAVEQNALIRARTVRQALQTASMYRRRSHPVATVAAFDTRRIVGLTFAFAALGAALVFAQPVTRIVQREWSAWQNRPDPIVATEEEMASIIRTVVLANPPFPGLPPPPPAPGEVQSEATTPRDILLVDRSAAFCPAPEPKGVGSRCAAGSMGAYMDASWDPALPMKLQLELELANRVQKAVPDPHLPTVRLTQADVIDAIFEQGGWDEFYRRFPGTAGTMRVGVPVLTEDRSKALVYVELMCDGLCGVGQAYLLERTAQGWKQIAKFQLWIS